MNENQEETVASPKKKAPAIVVKFSPKKSSIDDLSRAEPNAIFMIAPAGTSEDSLKASGLEAVVEDGQPLLTRGGIIVRAVGDKQKKEISGMAKAATRQVSEIREVKREDKVSVAKKPKEPLSEDEESD